jgi:hypothetical protein
MATQLQIKRSTADVVPAITYGELAYSTRTTATGDTAGGYIWVSDSANAPRVIGGDHFVKMLDHTAGTLTANNAIVVNNGSKIDQLKTTNITVGGSNLTFGVSADIVIPDANASALQITDGTNNHLTIDSSANTVTINSKVGGDIKFSPSDANITFPTTLTIADQTAGTPVEYMSFTGTTVTVSQDLDIGSNTLSMSGDLSAASGTFAEDNATVTIKNTTDQNANEEADTYLKMTDHNNNALATLFASHKGTLNDAQGQLKISTGSDTTTGGSNHAGTVAVTIDSAQKTTFAGHVDVGTSSTAKDLRVYGDLQVDGDTVTINTATLTVEDDLITISKGNDTHAAANNSGVEIDVTGAEANIHWKYIHANTAWQSNVSADLATTGEVYKIAGTSVLSNDTLGANVAYSTLTQVSALNSGSITSGFGAIDNGTDNITSGGRIKIDVDGTANAAGSLTLGLGSDASLYVLTADNSLQVNAGVNTVAMTAGDVTMFDATNSGNPSLSLGAAATDALKITATTDATAKLTGVTFATPSAGTFTTIDFEHDGTKKLGVTSTGITVDGGTVGLPNSASIAESNTGDVTIATPLAKALKLETGDVTIFDTTVAGNPSISLGSMAADALKISVVQQSGTDNMETVHFETAGADASTANVGKYKFSVQGTAIVDIDDDGLTGYGSLATAGNSWIATAPHLDNFVIDGGSWS